MRKFYSEAFEAMYEDVLADFELGIITEAELREFEAEAFIEEEETLQEQNPVAKEHATA